MAPAVMPGPPGMISPKEALEGAIRRSNDLNFVIKRKLNIVADSSCQPCINFLLPTLDTSLIYGGYISAFQFAGFLQRIGFLVRIIVVEQPIRTSLEHIISACDTALPAASSILRTCQVIERTAGNEEPVLISRDDLFIAYNSASAQLAYNSMEQPKKDPFIFYIQEEEGHFHSHNSYRAFCESVYDLPHLGIYNSPQLVRYFEKMGLGNFSSDARCKEHISYRHALNTAALPSERELAYRKTKKLVFFARPERHAERNLFELGLLSLKEACADNAFPPGAWELHAIGSVNSEPLNMPGGQKLYFPGKLPLDQYARSLSGYDVGLSLMFAPHPSVPNLEMSAAGLPTVTTTFHSRSALEMESISRNLIAVKPSVKSITAGLFQAKKRATQFRQRLEDAQFDWPRSWKDSFDEDFERILLSKLERVYGTGRIARLRGQKKALPAAQETTLE